MSVPPQQMGQQSESVAIPKRWPLITTASNRNESFLEDSRLINAYAEKDQNTGDWVVQKRIGLLLDSLETPFLPGFNFSRGLGLYNWNLNGASPFANGGDLYAMWSVGGTNSARLYKNGQLFTSTAFAGSGRANFIETRGTPQFLVFTSPGDFVWYTDGVNPPINANQVSFPTTNSFNVGIQYLNGLIYVMNSAGEIVNNSLADDPSQWDPSNLIIARSRPGIAMALMKQSTFIVALKANSTEVFYDNGTIQTTGSPLAPVPSALSDYGCGSTDSVQEIDGVLLWLSSNKSVSPQIVSMSNLHVKVISTPPIERLLQKALFQSASIFFSFPIVGWTLKYAGHRFYGLTIQSLNVTLVYDLDQELWYQWSDVNGNLWNMSVFAGDKLNRLVGQGFNNGSMYFIGGDKQYPTDDGDVYPVDIYTPNYDAGTRRNKTLAQMTFDADQVPGSILQVRRNNKDFNPESWSNFRIVDLSVEKPHLDNCGTFKRRSYHFRHQKPTAFRLRAAELQLDIGTL